MQKKSGFTIVELLMAVAILSILAVAGFTAFRQSEIRGRDVKRKQDLKEIATALEVYYQQHRHYPCTGTAPESWQYSFNAGAANWITDVAISGTTCGVNGTSTVLPTSYITLPQDPKNNGIQPWLATPENFSYAYFSGNWEGCKAGQSYWLVARLENPSDADSYARKEIHPCNYATYPVNTWAPGAYMISVY